MQQHYNLSGMTCSSCEAKVKDSLLAVPGVMSVEISRVSESAFLHLDKSVQLADLQNALDNKYTISPKIKNVDHGVSKSWLATYRPVILIFAYLLVASLVLEFTFEIPSIARLMRHFMAGFFLTFSFFKMLNLHEFKNSYAMYDIIARKFPFWGYVYAFTELGLGFAYLVNVNPVLTNTITLVVMSISIIGVFQTVLNKKSIQCACLGSVFQLPMSTVTIIEDGLMILMSASMLLMAFF